MLKKRFKNNKIILAIMSVMLIATITFAVLLFTIKPINKSDKSAKNGYIGKVSIINPAVSDPLQYEFVPISDNSDKTRFVYYTTESSDERLIAMNNRVIEELKKAGKINKNTKKYSIDYFSDAKAAKTYRTDINDANISQFKKMILNTKYVASMNYNKSMGINTLLSISKAKIVKKY